MMDDSQLPPMSNAARELLAVERASGLAPVGARARAFARVSAKLAGAPLPSNAPPVQHAGSATSSATSGSGALAGAVKLGAVLLVGAAMGSGATILVTQKPAAPPSGLVQPAASPSVALAAEQAAPPVIEPAPPLRAADPSERTPSRHAPSVAPAPQAAPSSSNRAESAPENVPSVSPPESHSAASVARERVFVDEARSALARQDASAAIAAAQSHEREFPNGQLAAEREAVMIRALVLANRRDEAAARAARFRAAYPNSVLLPVVDGALSSPKR